MMPKTPFILKQNIELFMGLECRVLTALRSIKFHPSTSSSDSFPTNH